MLMGSVGSCREVRSPRMTWQLEEWRFHLLKWGHLCEEQICYRNQDSHFEEVRLEVPVDIEV